MAREAKKVRLKAEWRRALVTKWGGIVIKVACRYFPNGMAIPEDVIQEGMLGLCIAAGRFEPERGLKFSTYAQHWVKALILENIIRNHGPTRFGSTRAARHVFFNLGKIKKALPPELQDNTEVLAARLGVDVRTLEVMRQRIAHADVSLDEVGLGEGASPRLQLASEDATPEEEYGDLEAIDEVKSVVRAAVGKLKARDRQIVKARYLSTRPKTLAEIGRGLRLSRERVRQLEARALLQLEKLLRGKFREVA